MFYLWHGEESETKASIKSIVHERFVENYTSEKMAIAIRVDSFPEDRRKENMDLIVFINPTTKEYIYEFIPKVASEIPADTYENKQHIQSLGKQLTLLQIENLQQKQVNNNLGKQLVQSQLEIMQLKKGAN